MNHEYNDLDKLLLQYNIKHKHALGVNQNKTFRNLKKYVYLTRLLENLDIYQLLISTTTCILASKHSIVCI